MSFHDQQHQGNLSRGWQEEVPIVVNVGIKHFPNEVVPARSNWVACTFNYLVLVSNAGRFSR